MFDPVSGQLTNSIELPSGAASEPIVVGDTLYVINKEGQLLAFR
jgi:sugar lactone lactonase YvrE